MLGENIDNYVWERYESWPGYDSFKAHILDHFPLLFIFHPNLWCQICEHAEEKAEEHGKKYMKLKLFRDSLDPQMRDCVEPFLIQQDKLRLAYRSIYLSRL